ncbi:MAG: hypothetical protein IAI50_01420, partial [Candidatus Eremiobacteraeota bacterium]|nr:hypothetical protein [Candidatus Eremiobacteraeota bacterium]
GFIVALIDATLERSSGRTIEALAPLDDETLCAFASDLLGEPDLDASRLIETYLEPMLARESS